MVASPGGWWVSPYTPRSRRAFVASIAHGFVEGDSGAVFDSSARLFDPPGTFPATWVQRLAEGPERRERATERFGTLATLIQPYGWMYYHFVCETLPKLVQLRDVLPAESWGGGEGAAASTPPANGSSSDSSGGDSGGGDAPSPLRLLLWGQPWEAAWLELLRIPRGAPVALRPDTRYAASTLLLPSPVEAVTPSREALVAARDAVRSAVGESPRRSLRRTLVYASRQGERGRRVANEASLVAALGAAFPEFTVVVHTRETQPREAVAMFAAAAAVVGPHGAGLSHIMFCERGTPVVELVFMHSPPMMFWHIASALGLRYAMAPLPRSYWRAHRRAAPRVAHRS